jgi:hypothetical protein
MDYRNNRFKFNPIIVCTLNSIYVRQNPFGNDMKKIESPGKSGSNTGLYKSPKNV